MDLGAHVAPFGPHRGHGVPRSLGGSLTQRIIRDPSRDQVVPGKEPASYLVRLGRGCRGISLSLCPWPSLWVPRDQLLLQVTWGTKV